MTHDHYEVPAVMHRTHRRSDDLGAPSALMVVIVLGAALATAAGIGWAAWQLIRNASAAGVW